MHLRKRLARAMRWVLIPVVALSFSIQAAPRALADDSALQQAKQRQADKQAEMNAAQNSLQKAKADAEAADAQLTAVQIELDTANNQLAVLQNQQQQTTAALDKVNADLKVTQARYAERKSLFDARIRTISEDGRVSYLAVLMGSNSFGDFISRWDMLKAVIKRDAELFQQIRDDQATLQKQQQEAVTRKNQLQTLVAQAQDRKSQVESKRAERQQVSRSLDMKKQALQDEYDQLARDNDAIRQQIDALIAQQNRPRVSSGGFNPIYPVASYTITDTFGPRIDPVLGTHGYHYGTDFANSAGTPVMAIADGVVVEADNDGGYHGGYGNLVVIDHGGGYVSYYGHNQSVIVRVGDTVKQGQRIALMGSTGKSTGPHCHLEIHVNGTPVDPMTFY